MHTQTVKPHSPTMAAAMALSTVRTLPLHARPTAANESISVVNMAARQRMLSQRMILQTMLAASGSDTHLQAAQKSFQQFCDSHATLKSKASDFDATSAQKVRDIYDGSRGVGSRIEQFMQQMRTTLQCISNKGAHTEPLNTLISSTDSVLEALNAVTTTFDNITKGKAEQIMKELTDIVSGIQTVAREAKVVSFNAQVIAARAGQHGREFAVVANVLSNISAEIDGMSRTAVNLVERNKQIA